MMIYMCVSWCVHCSDRVICDLKHKVNQMVQKGLAEMEREREENKGKRGGALVTGLTGPRQWASTRPEPLWSESMQMIRL